MVIGIGADSFYQFILVVVRRNPVDILDVTTTFGTHKKRERHAGLLHILKINRRSRVMHDPNNTQGVDITLRAKTCDIFI